jgi:hypothetical protein
MVCSHSTKELERRNIGTLRLKLFRIIFNIKVMIESEKGRDRQKVKRDRQRVISESKK